MSKKRKDAPNGRAAKERSRSASSESSRTSNGAAPASVADHAAWHAVRSPLRLQILEAIRAAPGVDARTLSVALNTSAPRLYYHINILLESGLIVGVDGSDGAARRTSSRGPEALVYRARSSSFPDGFFTRDGQSQRRREALVRELFEGGMGVALSSHAKNSSHLTVRREHLTAAEAARVKTLLGQIEGILDEARTRRHQDSKVVAATHFVGCTFCELDGELPDGPLEAR